MPDSSQFWVAAAAGAGVATAIGSFVIWALSAKFKESVMDCVKAGTADLRDALELDKLEEAVRTVSHTVGGINEIVMTHEDQLRNLTALSSIADSVGRMADSLVEVNKKLYTQGTSLAHIKGRLNIKNSENGD